MELRGAGAQGAGAARLVLRVLGPLHAELDGAEVALAPAERAVLACLALDPRGAVSADRLSDAVWPGGRPGSARASLHNHLARLRGKLGPGAVERADDRYRLGAAVVVDADLLEPALEAGERLLHDGAAEAACAQAEQALAAVRGPAYSDLSTPEAQAAARRVAEVVASLEDVRAAALLERAHVGTAVAVLQRLVEEEPGREHRWTLLVRALHAQGRRGEALAAYARARRELASTSGLGPSAGLTAAAAQVLADGDGPAAGATDRLPVAVAAFVGRQDELARARARLAAGVPLLAVVGPPGSGTSRLAAELASAVARDPGGPAAVVLSRCERAPDVPLQPLVDFADALRERLGDDRYAHTAGPDGALLSRRPAVWARPRLDGPADVPGRLVRALGRAARAVGGVVLVVDDAYLAGPTTASVLGRLAHEPGVLVVLTAPEGAWLPGDLAAAETAIVAGLPVPAVHRLVAGLLDRSEVETAALADWVVEEAGTAPGAVHAVLQALVAEGLVSPSAPGPLPVPRESGFPDRLTEQVRARVAALAPAERAALEAAAVLDGPAAARLLPRLCAPGHLVALRAGGLLPASAHLRRVVLADLAPARRLEVLAAAAGSAEALGLSRQTVAHYRVAAAALDPSGAVRAARAAGDEAMAAGAFGEAAGWYDRALDIVTSLPAGALPAVDRLGLVARRGNAHRLAGTPGYAEPLLAATEELLDLLEASPGDGALREECRAAALAIAQLGATSEAGATNTRAATAVDRALAVEVDRPTRAVLAAAASMVHSMGERPQRCRDLYLLADADSRHLAGADSAVRRQVLPFAYLALGHPDDLALRTAAMQELRAAADAAQDPVAAFEAHHLAASVALLTCDGAGLRAAHQALRALSDVVGDVGRRWSWHYTDAALAHLEARLDEAEQLSSVALEVGSGVTASRALAVHGAQLLDVRRAQGRLGELSGLFEQLLVDQPGVRAWHAAAALARAVPGPDADDDAARAHLDALLAGGLGTLPRDFTFLASATYAGRAAAAVGCGTSGDRERAETLLAGLTPYADLGAWCGSCSYGPVAVVAARLALALGDVGGAGAHLARAGELARRLGSRLFAAEADQLVAATQRAPGAQPS